MIFQPHTHLHIDMYQASQILHTNPWECATKSTMQLEKFPHVCNFFICGSHNDISTNFDSHLTKLPP